MNHVFADAVMALIDKCLLELHTCFPATIISYDPATNRAKLQPKIRLKTDDNRFFLYPQIANVPVYNFQGQVAGATIALPISAGDDCLVLCAEKTLDYWQYASDDETQLMYDLTNAIAIHGLSAKVNNEQKRSCNQDKIIIDKNGTVIEVSDDMVFIKKGSCTITVNGSHIGINGNTDVVGNVTVSGDLTVGGDITAGGDMSANSLNISGNGRVEGSFYAGTYLNLPETE